MSKNRTLVVGGGICVILLLVALIFLFRFNAAYQSEKRVLKKQYRELAELNNHNPFPSEANRIQFEKNTDTLAASLGRLEEWLGRDPLPPDAREAADFSARAQRSIERFRERALAAGVALPDSLEAGFAQYASGGAIPNPVHVPRLSRQLYSMERVSDVLIACGVASVDALSRDVFESLPEPVKTPPSMRRSRRSRVEEDPVTPEKDNHLVASFAEPNGLYWTERIGVSFTAKEPAVWAVLVQLAAAEHFMVVVDFSFETQTDIMAYDPKAAEKVATDELERFAAEGILSGKTALSRIERLKAGDELLRVSLVVDVYNFNPSDEVGRTL